MSCGQNFLITEIHHRNKQHTHAEWIVTLILFFLSRHPSGNLLWAWRRLRRHSWWSTYRWIRCSSFIPFGGSHVDCGFNCRRSYPTLHFETKGKHEKGSKGTCGTYNEYNEINASKASQNGYKIFLTRGKRREATHRS